MPHVKRFAPHLPTKTGQLKPIIRVCYPLHTHAWRQRRRSGWPQVVPTVPLQALRMAVARGCMAGQWRGIVLDYVINLRGSVSHIRKLVFGEISKRFSREKIPIRFMDYTAQVWNVLIIGLLLVPMELVMLLGYANSAA